jgi:hypothetical protein
MPNAYVMIALRHTVLTLDTILGVATAASWNTMRARCGVMTLWHRHFRRDGNRWSEWHNKRRNRAQESKTNPFSHCRLPLRYFRNNLKAAEKIFYPNATFARDQGEEPQNPRVGLVISQGNAIGLTAQQDSSDGIL